MLLYIVKGVRDRENKVDYNSLANALRYHNMNKQKLGFVHHESSMYSMERVGDLFQPLKEWKEHLQSGQQVQVFYNFHTDLKKRDLRVHLLYSINERVINSDKLDRGEDIVSVFSCNLENLLQIFQEHLIDIEIEQPRRSLKKIAYLKKDVDLSNEDEELSKELIGQFVQLQKQN